MRPTAGTESLLLPTPNPFHATNTETPDQWRARRAEVKQRTGTMHGPALQVILLSLADGTPLVPGEYTPDQLLPTPTASEAKGGLGGTRQGGPSLRMAAGALPEHGVPDTLDPPGEQLAIPLPGEPVDTQWGPYAAAVHRWEPIIGRPAPPPLTDGALSPRFVEWVMGLPEGWVTDVPGLSRAAMLRMLGNGVVPQHAAYALTHLGIPRP